jgi:hypothetical protein
VILPHGDHLVDDLLGGMALALALLDLLGVAAALDNCAESSQHTGWRAAGCYKPWSRAIFSST